MPLVGWLVGALPLSRTYTVVVGEEVSVCMVWGREDALLEWESVEVRPVSPAYMAGEFG